MRTPRPSTPTRRGFTTLIGNGWLRESPKNLWPHGWDIKSRSALRKCLFMPVPPEAQEFIRSLPPPKPFQAVPLQNIAPRPTTPPPRPRDPRRDARAFEALSPEDVKALQRKKLLADAQRAALGKRVRVDVPPASDAASPWYDDPIALGSLLILMPPMGLAALWTSKRYSSDARWALTMMTGLTMCLVAAVVIAIVALQR